MTLSANAVGYYSVSFLEALPPAGYTGSFDVGGSQANSSCSASCNGVALSLTATDIVFQVADPGTNTAGPLACSSPYVTDSNGNCVYLNATSGSAPTTAQATTSYNSIVAVAFKTTAGSFTKPALPFTMQNIVATNAGTLNCSPTCSLTVPSTGSGHLLYFVSAGEASQVTFQPRRCPRVGAPGSCRRTAGALWRAPRIQSVAPTCYRVLQVQLPFR